MPIPVILEKGSGLTHDISPLGIYFETNQAIDKVDDLLCFTLYFSDFDEFQSYLYRCSGRILRINKLETGKTGIAVYFSDIGDAETIGNISFKLN